MFVNCPHCRTLVATAPATDLPPPFCPECAGPLRDGPASAAHTEPPGAEHRGQSDAPADQRDSWWDEAAARTHEAPQTRTDAADPTEAAPTEAAPTEADPTEADPTVADPTRAAQDAEVTGTEATAADPTAPAPTSAGTTAAALAAARVAPLRTAMPGFLRGRAGAPARRDWRMPAAIVGLSLLLALQMLLADRDRLGGQAAWRPLLTALCGALGCELPPWREPGAFTLLQRDVREHPVVPGALRVSATFRNDARWAQPWPRLQLSLADADGRVAGVRRFTAEEYLGGAPAQAELASGETATVAMDILEPAPGIVSFDFGFR